MDIRKFFTPKPDSEATNCNNASVQHGDSESADVDNRQLKENASKDGSANSSWYKGCKVDVSWLKQTFPSLTPIKLGKRNGLKCVVCFDNIVEAQKAARNGTVPIADGIRCDERKAIQRVIDHMKSEVHAAAERAQTMKIAWDSQNDSHPWVRILKSHKLEVVQVLIRLAVDVHNDSQVKTLSAWSWPSRYLAQRHAENQISQYVDHGQESEFVPFKPKAASLPYVSPQIYSEMLSIVADIELENLSDKLSKCDCFSIQLDKSVDKYNVQSLFGTVRFFDEDYSMNIGFIGECHSQLHGAEGMLDAFLLRIRDLNLEEKVKEKLVGLTTDGENANTGAHCGLWKAMSDFLEHGLMTVWCVAHRSDLAFESIEASVPEVRHWLADIRAVSKYFRASSRREGDLIAQALSAGKEEKSVKRFPRYHEVRFAEHLLNLVNAVLSNLEFMLLHWESVHSSGGSRTERLQAVGFHKSWMPGSFNYRMTFLMADILLLFTNLQKESQRARITLPDLLLYRDRVCCSLELMENSAYPGGKEEELSVNSTLTDSEPPAKRQKGHHTLVSTPRNFTAVRQEVVLSSKSFLEERINDEQEEQVQAMIGVANANNATELINAGRSSVEHIFGKSYVQSFADDAIGYFVSHGARSFKASDCTTAKLYELLQKSTKKTILNRLIQTFLVTSPHSMLTERAVKCHTLLKSDLRSSLSRDSMNDRMCIALNSPGTANFDPRRPVATFLSRKERRNKLPDSDIFVQRDFVKNLFARENMV